MTPPPIRFTLEDAHAANEAWGCNCGPGALAAVMGLTLDQVRQHIAGFEARRYTNVPMMRAALESLGVPFKIEEGTVWPRYGLCRVQWHGPWMKPRVPHRARAGKTHWIGACRQDGRVAVFDINAIGNGSGWVALADWQGILVPFLIDAIRNADGEWHITHAIEIGRP